MARLNRRKAYTAAVAPNINASARNNHSGPPSEPLAQGSITFRLKPNVGKRSARRCSALLPSTGRLIINHRARPIHRKTCREGNLQPLAASCPTQPIVRNNYQLNNQLLHSHRSFAPNLWFRFRFLFITPRSSTTTLSSETQGHRQQQCSSLCLQGAPRVACMRP